MNRQALIDALTTDNTGADRLAGELRQLLEDLRKATDKDFSLGLMRIRVKHLCDLLPDAEQDPLAGKAVGE